MLKKQFLAISLARTSHFIPWNSIMDNIYNWVFLVIGAITLKLELVSGRRLGVMAAEAKELENQAVVAEQLKGSTANCETPLNSELFTMCLSFQRSPFVLNLYQCCYSSAHKYEDKTLSYND